MTNPPLSFGAPKTTTPTTGTASSTGLGSSAPKPFSLTPSTTSGTTTTSSTTTPSSSFSFGGFGKPAAPETPVEVPDELKTKTVREVLDDFEKQLEQQAHKFDQQARRIARWDRAIYDCMALVRHLEEQINTIDGAQKELQQNTKHLLEDQEDFLKKLRAKTQARPPASNDSLTWKIN
jgi:hypothetical protein